MPKDTVAFLFARFGSRRALPLSQIAQLSAAMSEEPKAACIVDKPTGKSIDSQACNSQGHSGRRRKPRRGIQGLYVISELHHHGIARELLHTSLNWVRKKRRVAFASDRAERIVVQGDSSKWIWLRPTDAARRKIECLQGLLPSMIFDQAKNAEAADEVEGSFKTMEGVQF